MDASPVVCIICDARLLPTNECAPSIECLQSAPRASAAKDDVSVLANCGHVFHRKCLGKWLSRSLSCPTCRRQVVPDRDIVTKLFFNQDDNPAESEEETPSDVRPWYERYAGELSALGVGAILGAVGGVILGSFFGGQKTPSTTENTNRRRTNDSDDDQ